MDINERHGREFELQLTFANKKLKASKYELKYLLHVYYDSFLRLITVAWYGNT